MTLFRRKIFTHYDSRKKDDVGEVIRPYQKTLDLMYLELQYDSNVPSSSLSNSLLNRPFQSIFLGGGTCLMLLDTGRHFAGK